MTKLPVAAGLALALVAGSALAADLPSHKAPPLPPPPPPFTWTGLYGGINIGYGFGNNDPLTGTNLYSGNLIGTVPALTGVWNTNTDLNGIVGGGQVGYNYQFSPWLVIGVEADIQAADLRSQRSVTSPFIDGTSGLVPHFGAINTNQSVDWFGTVRGRIGLTMPSWPNLMVYGTGGFAYGGVSQNFGYADLYPGVFGGAVIYGRGWRDETQTGWTAGGGLEWTPMAFPAWSLKVEYLYTDLGTTVLTAPVTQPVFAGVAAFSTATQTGAIRWHTVRAGLNWHFNPFAAAPVLAKY